jgi:hypothetical protein
MEVNMKKSTATIMAMSGLLVFLLLFSGCKAKSDDAAKNVEPAQKVVEAETEKIGKVIDINGSIITYALGEGKKETVTASTFPGSLKVGDMITVKDENGQVAIAKYRGKKVPIGC